MFERIIRNPVASWTVGIIITFLLSSLAAAGMNTLFVARLMLVFAVATFGVVLFATQPAKKIRTSHRAALLIITIILSIGIERWETWNQPKKQTEERPKLPRPPLRLLLEPEEPFSIRHPMLLRDEELVIDYVPFPEGGFARFSMVDSEDDAMLGVANFDIRNISKEPKQLSWSLKIRGEGRNFTLPGDGRGRWERQLNRSDWMAERNGRELAWLLSPLDIPPGKHKHGPLAFVAPLATQDLKALIVSNGKRKDLPTFS